MTLEQLKEILDKHFGEPFLPVGAVEANWMGTAPKECLQIRIGRRDVWLTKDGKVVSQGTILKPGENMHVCL